jgi:hypothetical protein
MNNIIKTLKDTIRKATGRDLGIVSGRSAEINLRVARLMGRAVLCETSQEEYDRIAREAKVESRIR